MLPYQRLVRKFLKRDYEILGRGCYSIVFKSKDGKRAIKIGSTLSDPWLVYAQQVEHSSNLHFPKIYYLKCCECENYYVAVTERLDQVKSIDDSFNSFRDSMLNNYSNIASEREAVLLLNRLLNTMDYARLDLHLDNIMLRGDTFVLNDPLAEREVDSSFEAWIEENLFDEHG